MHQSEKWKRSCSVVSNSLWSHGLQPTRLLHPWDFPGKSTGVGCHCLLWLVCLEEKITSIKLKKKWLVFYLKSRLEFSCKPVYIIWKRKSYLMRSCCFPSRFKCNYNKTMFACSRVRCLNKSINFWKHRKERCFVYFYFHINFSTDREWQSNGLRDH